MDDKERTLYCGNLSEKVTEDILYELFLQAGPLESVSIPKDKDGKKRNFGFVTFKHSVSVPYSVALMNGVTLYGKPMRLELRTGAESEHNPYLETLEVHRKSFVYPETYGRNYSEQYDSRSYAYDRREPLFSDRPLEQRMYSRDLPNMHSSYRQNQACVNSNNFVVDDLQRRDHYDQYRGSPSFRSRMDPNPGPWRRSNYY